MIKVIVNPFLKKICFCKKVKGCEVFDGAEYSENDEWGSFEINKQVYDWHLLYTPNMGDKCLQFDIYKVKNGKADYSKSVKCSVKIGY